MDWRTMLEAHVCARIWDAGPSGSEVTRPERPSAVGGGRPRPHQTLSLFFAHFRDESLGTCPAHKHIVKTLMVLVVLFIFLAFLARMTDNGEQFNKVLASLATQ